MIFHSEVLNRQTGELVTVSLGDWVTVTELGESLGLGPIQIRQVLHRLGWVSQVWKLNGAYMLTPEAIASGYGRRVEPTKGSKGYAFDVISPPGQKIVLEKYPQVRKELEDERHRDPEVARGRDLLRVFKAQYPDRLTTIKEQVSWLDFYVPDLTGPQAALVLDTSHQMIRKCRHAAKRQREAITGRMNAEAGELMPCMA